MLTTGECSCRTLDMNSTANITNEDAIKADNADDMNRLGELLNEAFLLARKLEGRGIDMRSLGLASLTLKDFRNAAEDAYTRGKV